MQIGLLSVSNYVEPLPLAVDRFDIILHAQEADVHSAGSD